MIQGLGPEDLLLTQSGPPIAPHVSRSQSTRSIFLIRALLGTRGGSRELREFSTDEARDNKDDWLHNDLHTQKWFFLAEHHCTILPKRRHYSSQLHASFTCPPASDCLLSSMIFAPHEGLAGANQLPLPTPSARRANRASKTTYAGRWLQIRQRTGSRRLKFHAAHIAVNDDLNSVFIFDGLLCR